MVESDIFAQQSVGDWAACSQCASLINAHEWDALISRATICFFEQNPECIDVLPVAFVRGHLTEVYRRLREKNFYKVLEGV